MTALQRAVAATLTSLALAQGAAADDALGWLAKKVSKAANHAKVQRIAVLPFVSSSGAFPEDGVVISERLVSALVEREEVRVVERELLQNLMQEHYLANSGIVSPEGRRKIGQILSVDAVVTGSFVSFGKRAQVNARLIRIESGDILFARSFEIPVDWFDPYPMGHVGEESMLGWTQDAPGGCRQAQVQLAALERAVVDLKTRYLMSQLDSAAARAPQP